MDRRRISIAISGVVQGVGFRPFVYDLATRHGLHGFVRNQTGDVWIEVEGDAGALETFRADLTRRPPPLARIDRVAWSPRALGGESGFRIEVSQETAGPIFVSPDVGVCDDCLRELFDPADRRYRYPFLNCTNCGPRLTIITGAPYDRKRTTMAAFAMCSACRAEYDDPRDRRFHAQPTACPHCGPRLALVDGQGRDAANGGDPLARAIDLLRAGGIVAVKGLGGFHLTCLAASEPAVAALRRRKRREEKPFALMVRNVEGARALAEVADAEAALLVAPRRPIVLLRRRRDAAVAQSVAPGNPYLGVMLPYTPLHHLLLHDLDGAPLVATSGNASDEPIAFEDGDAQARLAGIADLFLTHDRPIHLRCDDSVTRVVDHVELPGRRSRGDAPCPINLPHACTRPTLALGGQMKSTFALGRGRHAFLSHHVGDLDHYVAYRAFVEAVAHYERLFSFQPERIVHDLHPDYASTRYAWTRCGDAIPRLAVQHHQAHVASCLADNEVDEPVIGVAFDGTGYGTDGAIWGGEFFVGDCRGFHRAAHLRYVAMPGGEQSVREPWRMAAAYLADAGLDDEPLRGRVSPLALGMVRQLIDRGFNAPLTSSAGRLFDGVAALLGIRDRVRFEGQAAMELEWLAWGATGMSAYPVTIENASPLIVDSRPLIIAVADDIRRGVEPEQVARRFHASVVEIVAQVCDRLRAACGLSLVALSGGVFQNALLTTQTVARLSRDGFRVLRHRRVPPNDGGLCLGQLALAAASEPA